MAFSNSLECHFSTINQTPSKTDIRIIIYKVSDGGLDAEGNQLYNRILIKSFDYKLDAGWDKQRILDYFLAKLAEINTTFSLGYTSDKFIVTL